VDLLVRLYPSPRHSIERAIVHCSTASSWVGGGVVVRPSLTNDATRCVMIKPTTTTTISICCCSWWCSSRPRRITALAISLQQTIVHNWELPVVKVEVCSRIGSGDPTTGSWGASRRARRKKWCILFVIEPIWWKRNSICLLFYVGLCMYGFILLLTISQ